MLNWDQHCLSLSAVKTATRYPNGREFRDPHDPYSMGGPMQKLVKGTTCSTAVIWVKTFQTKFMVEICFKSLVRAIGFKVLLMKFS